MSDDGDRIDDNRGDGAGGSGSQQWDPDAYEGDHGYVYEYGADVVDLLDPRPGERILDLGCGTGHLTAEIVSRVGDEGDEGAVLGVDSSPEMIAEAREAYPDIAFVVADATSLATDDTFDAVFSNAALHWIEAQDEVTERVHETLVPGGRFVAELGGHGNVAWIRGTVADELADRGHDAPDPFYFPSVGEHASLLERRGLEVRLATLFDRPTELEGGDDGLRNWLAMFGEGLLAPVEEDEREEVIDAVEERLRDDLYDPEDRAWTADYRRLRFVAVRE